MWWKKELKMFPEILRLSQKARSHEHLEGQSWSSKSPDSLTGPQEIRASLQRWIKLCQNRLLLVKGAHLFCQGQPLREQKRRVQQRTWRLWASGKRIVSRHGMHPFLLNPHTFYFLTILKLYLANSTSTFHSFEFFYFTYSTFSAQKLAYSPPIDSQSRGPQAWGPQLDLQLEQQSAEPPNGGSYPSLIAAGHPPLWFLSHSKNWSGKREGLQTVMRQKSMVQIHLWRKLREVIVPLVTMWLCCRKRNM